MPSDSTPIAERQVYAQDTQPSNERDGVLWVDTSVPSGPPKTNVYDADTGSWEPLSATPSGAIMMWSGDPSNTPSGWVLCDGNNGTPDLRDRFVVGAGGSYAADDTGGAESVALTEAELAPHSHSIDYADDSADFDTGQVATNDNGAAGTVSTNSSGSGDAHENRPPYYALAYIMKV